MPECSFGVLLLVLLSVVASTTMVLPVHVVFSHIHIPAKSSYNPPHCAQDHSDGKVLVVADGKV